ncbi:hypothetical protein [Ramlibacter humi]|uniref:SbsA Ig-like domain-containing protein n=1 Tax=Ramlibacter humi TaxID=2530451 RepID=A0A4Z0BPB6_9BURK|nr:hypothetical protein [Ramlibacter humi]TFZ00260.1 hypothetical protein EZ216_14265 [Ramlibacter humi]
MAVNNLSNRVFRTVLAIAVASAVAACGGGDGPVTGAGGLGDSGGEPSGNPTGNPSGNPSGNPTDTTAPTASLNIAAGALDKSQSVVIRFSESMAIGTLQLGGDLAANAVPTWSATQSANDTLTLTPSGGSWPFGVALGLSVAASDLAGNAMAKVQTSYQAKLAFGAFPAAGTVFGQQDFSSNDSQQGLANPTVRTLSAPAGNVIFSSTGTVFVADSNNNRIMLYGSTPSATNEAALGFLGQPDGNSNVSGTTRVRYHFPRGLSAGGGRAAITDTANNRVLIYPTLPLDLSVLPDVVVGQSDFTTSSTACGATNFDSPSGSALTEDGKLLVADAAHNRVLIWNQVPITNGAAPDLVLGQKDSSHCGANDDLQDGGNHVAPTARTLNFPSGVWSDGQRVVVLDMLNQRALVWNTFPTSSFQPADLVIGQKTFSARKANDDNQDGAEDASASARTLNFPNGGIAFNGVQLAIADTGNHRVLIWNAFPTANFQPADAVLGHAGFAGKAENDSDGDGNPDTPNGAVFSSPNGLGMHGDKLFVVDNGNHRVLVFSVP